MKGHGREAGGYGLGSLRRALGWGFVCVCVCPNIVAEQFNDVKVMRLFMLDDEVMDYDRWFEVVGRVDLIENLYRSKAEGAKPGRAELVAEKCPFKVCPLESSDLEVIDGGR